MRECKWDAQHDTGSPKSPWLHGLRSSPIQMKGVCHDRTMLALAAWSLAALTGLSACVYPGPHPHGGGPYPPAAHERCNASAALAVSRGRRPTTAVQQRARHAANALTVRILLKNQPVTLEYLSGRLNLVVNEAGVIESASCG